jgi:hypothetical protein
VDKAEVVLAVVKDVDSSSDSLGDFNNKIVIRTKPFDKHGPYSKKE